MTDKLNPEQRRRVAEAATGKEWIVCTFGPNGGGMTYVAYKKNPCSAPFWDPKRRLEHKWALVRWLAKTNIEKDGPIDDADIVDAIADDNTEALERMVHETLETQDD